MKCARSPKDRILTHYGLWMLHEGLIQTAREFEPIRKPLRRLTVEKLQAEIAARKAIAIEVKAEIAAEVALVRRFGPDTED